MAQQALVQGLQVQEMAVTGLVTYYAQVLRKLVVVEEQANQTLAQVRQAQVGAARATIQERQTLVAVGEVAGTAEQVLRHKTAALASSSFATKPHQ
jgi:hypothetical protein